MSRADGAVRPSAGATGSRGVAAWILRLLCVSLPVGGTGGSSVALAAGRDRARRIVLSGAAAVALIAVVFAAPGVSEASKRVDSFFPAAGGSGTTGDRFNGPHDVAVRESTGQIYVVDGSNNRISRFSSAGVFERTWGADVGGLNEQQRVTVSATGGSLTLTFAGQTTAPIAFNASGLAVRTALLGLSNVETGEVDVSGGAGTWTVEFTGALSGTDHAEMSADPAGLTGGASSVDVETLVDGVGGNDTGFEICTDAALCKRGAATGGNVGDNLRNGSVSDAAGAAVNQATGDVFVRDRDNRRVNQYDADGNFIRSWGFDVVRGVDEQQTLTINATAGQFRLSFGSQTTGDLAFNATAATVRNALNGLSSVTAGGASVSVTGGPGGTAPYTITFLSDSDVAELVAVDGTTPLSGGAASATVTTVQNGSGGGVGFEICSAAEHCQAGTPGPRPGQFSGSGSGGGGIAVSPVDGHVFVVDPGGGLFEAGGRRLLEFGADGQFVRAFGWGVLDGSAAFQICTTSCVAAPAGIGIENGRFNAGDSPGALAIDDAGTVYASDNPDSNRIQRFDSTATAAGEVLLSPLETNAITGAVPIDRVSGLAFNHLTGRLFVSIITQTNAEVGVFEIDPAAGTLVDTHMAGSGLAAAGIRVDETRDRLLVASSSGSAHRVYVADNDGASGALVAQIDPPAGVTAYEASFSGSVNPGGFPVTASFQLSKDGVEYQDVGAPQDLGDGLDEVPIAASTTTLEANTAYWLRISATRGFGNGSVTTAPVMFVTAAAAPEVETGVALGRTDTSAFVNAQINPNGMATSYRFEYGQTTAYGNLAPVPDASAGSGGLVQEFRQTLSGLQPDTLYHYRVVATNAQGTSIGADQTVTTRPAAAGAAGRAYELVSPADKFGGTGVGEWYQGVGSMAHSGVAAHEGERFAVQSSFGSVMLSDPAFSFANDWALAERVDDRTGWRSHTPLTHPSRREALASFLTLRANIVWPVGV
jgi:DNA-binding beta-propeller fold protein YncE